MYINTYTYTNSLVCNDGLTRTNVYSTSLIPVAASLYTATSTALICVHNISTWCCGDK